MIGQIATGVEKIKRAIDSGVNVGVVEDINSGTIPWQASFQDAAIHNAMRQDEVFVFGIHEWGDEEARVGK